MREKVVVDSSVLVKTLLENEKGIILSLLENYELSSPSNVLEETTYKTIVLTISNLIDSNKFHKIKKAWEKGIGEPEIRKRIDILEDLTTTIIKVLYANEKILYLSKKISFEYKLLPNDALIAATCKYYGINKIATFDPDFKRVDFLEIVTPE
ncbi:MAG: PIN domain-containing protein [Methanophagales archaeon]|nr:PIN domain-containing protein [Methanophagales archaeon]